MAAIDSRPIRAHHSSHVHASFLHGIELCCIRCNKLVQEKSCTRNHVRRSLFLYKSTCTSFLYKFLDCVSPPLGPATHFASYRRRFRTDKGCLEARPICGALNRRGVREPNSATRSLPTCATTIDYVRDVL